ncbi:exosortase family protein XrtF [Salinibacter ruber]|uniref:exosortase X n=1 Tax=Salinibacter ruber TaxID=146919 RepID=UPI0021694D7F|nr:exosortase/archaeosortase family protein [Salinibacter ruber]MCS3753149.1 exosortase family protein XrtF [Salinibacter ruber]
MSADSNSQSQLSRYEPVLRFLGKVIAVYGAWYLLYDLWLLPDGWLDRWVSFSVVQVGEAALRVVGFEAADEARNLTLSGTSGIKVVDGCNGLASIGLFVGFVVAYPGRAWRRALFIPLGILVVYLSNVGRVSGLLLLQKYWGAGFDVAHSVGAPMFFYTVIFGLWVLWASYGGAESASSTDADEQTQAAFA